MKTKKQFIIPSILVLLFALCFGAVSCGGNSTDTEIPENAYVRLDQTAVELIVSDKIAITPAFSSEVVSKKNFRWSVSKPDIVSIEEHPNKSVNIVALKEGTVEIKIEDSGSDLSASCQITVLPKEGSGDNDAIHILGIGNSFTDDALQDYLYHLAAAGDKKIVIARLTVGGATLEEHLEYAQKDARYSYWKKEQNGNTFTDSKSIAEGVADETWDYISFQQQSWLAGQFDSYRAYIPKLVEYVKGKSLNSNTKYVMLQTWSFAYDYTYDDYDYYDNNQLVMHAALVDAAERASALVVPKMMVIPAGTAIQNGRTSIVGDKFCRDGYHLNVYIGRFTVACVWYEAIFGNVVDNPYKPDNISEYHAEIAKHAARLAVMKPDKVTEMLNFQ